MMEVKHNTAVDLNDLLTSPKNIGADEVDDVMTDLQERAAHNLVNCDLIKKNDETNLKIDEIENGDADMTSLDVDVGVDLNTTVNSELEDALLAEDDVLPEIPNAKTVESTSSTTDDILTEKAETSNSTTSSSNARDPGDDLDTLLSKINDIVEDCIQNERENTISDTMKTDETTNKVVETEKNINVNDESVTVMEDTSVTDESNLIEKEKVKEAVTNNIEEGLLHSDANENITDKDALISSNLPQNPQEVVKNVEEVTKNENSELEKGEKIGLELETETKKTSNDTVACESADIDNDNNTKENNLSVEKKTEESTTEIVQDSKITSNSSEVIEAVKTTGFAESVDNSEASSPKTFGTDEIEKTSQSNQELTTTLKKEPSESIEKNPNPNDTVTSVNMENDDSDDEIVFYVDKPPEVKKSKDTEEKSLDAEVGTTAATKKSAVEHETSSTKKTAQDDDDVVLLLDDDDEEANQVKRQESDGKDFLPKSANDEKEHDDSIKSNACTEEKNIVNDNSDNARDVFATDNSNENEKTVSKTEDIETPEDINSNCSSSSNLLQEAKSVKNTVDEPTLDEGENDDEEDDGDVELIDSELKESETSDKADDSETAPPAKRIRLSEDSEEISKKHETSVGETDEVEAINDVDKKQESLEYQEKLEKENSCTETHAILKRSHDVIEIEGDEKSNDSKIYSENSSKKQKTDIVEDDVVISDIVGEIGNDKETDDIKYVEDIKKNIKAVPSYEPIRLYPAPKFGILKTELPISLDFLKKFRKSFDNMTKNDLEDLVLQKVVEAIIHRSEFSEMRELIEKQEKVINAHRTKISELSKQFRDLEMVHNRVVKDIEQRNSQFIMPVKITRAVGLQVYIPNKKSLADPPTSSTGPNVPSSPQRSISSQGSSTLNTSITPPQRLLLSSQTDTMQQRATGTTTSGPANTSTVRRGCVQKITPIRPVPGANQPATTASAPITSVSYRNTPTLSAASQPRILNKNAANTSSASAIQRSRYLGSTQESQQRMATQQPISRTPNIPANSQRLVTNATTQSKPTSSIASSVQRRSEPITSQAANSSTSSIVDNYINTLTHLTGGNTAVSITPAKPKEKAVIDLTDEDETPGQSSSAPPLAQIPGAQVSRRSLPVPSNSNTQLQYGRGAPSLGRVPPANQIANNKNRQMSSLQGQNKNSFASISTPPGTSITRINVVPNATNSQRAKYGHPAPLPATPPQAFNPSWKLPPPRPTIRISNLDNGIVISWTMEESMDRHAECVSYQIYAYQETSGPPMVDSWRHVGDVKAMLLPMAVTLTQFQEGQRYYFAVRAVDCHQRCGPFSLPKTWS